MKRHVVQGLVLVAFVALLLTGCAFAPFSILGTWVFTTGVESIEFTATKFIVTDLTTFGRWECKIDKVEAGEDRLQMTTTEAAGSFDWISYEGEEWYLLWEVNGDTMYIGISTTGYPASASLGPYYKE